MAYSHRWIWVVVALVGVGLAGVAFPKDRNKLSAGKIYVETEHVDQSDTPRIVLTAVVDAPPADVWEIVTNCDKFESRMPNINEARIVSSSGDTVVCEVELDLPFPLSNLTAKTRAKHTFTGDKRQRRWTLISGDYEYNDGSWVLTPFDKAAKRTLVVYSVHAMPDTHVPDWVRERAQKSSLPDMIERVRQEASQL